MIEANADIARPPKVVRWLQIWVVCLSFFLPTSGWAQLPLPELHKPEVRIASADRLVDEVIQLVQRLEKTVAEREPEIEKAKSRLQGEIARYKTGIEPEIETEPVLFFDVELASRLVEELTRELDLHRTSLRLAKRALETAGTKAERPQRIKLDDLVTILFEARRLREESEARGVMAQRLESLVELERDSGISASLEEQLAEQEWRIQLAQADHAVARWLDSRANSRLAQQHEAQHRKALVVTPEDAERIRQELERARTADKVARDAIRQERIELREELSKVAVDTATDPVVAEAIRQAQRRIALAQFDRLSRREDAQQAKLLRARSRFLAVNALLGAQDMSFPTDLAPARIAALLARVEQFRSAAEGDISSLREQENETTSEKLKELLNRHRRVIDDTFATLLEIRKDLETVQMISSIRKTSAVGAAEPVPLWLRILLTVLVVLSGVLLFAYGVRYLRRFTENEAFKRRFPLRPKHLARLDTTLSLVWPIAIFCGCAAAIVWPIWNFEVSPLGALKVLDQPLFYIDEQSVSVFSIGKFLFALWVAMVLSRAVRDFLKTRVYVTLEWDIGLTNALSTLVHYVFVLVGLIVGLRFVGVGFSSLAIFAGVLGIGIGFGLRNVTENFISGLIILAERPIKIGDFIDIEGKAEGQIQSIRARSTTVVTRDNISLIIPNSEFVAGQVTNWSHGDPKVRLRIVVGVVYGSDTDLVRKILLEVANRHGQVLKRPPPDVQFSDFGSSSLDFWLLVWIEEQFHRFRIASDLRFAIDKAFRKVGIEIAFPQLDLHMKTISQDVRDVIAGPLPIPEVATTIDLPKHRQPIPRSPSRKGSGIGSGASRPAKEK